MLRISADDDENDYCGMKILLMLLLLRLLMLTMTMGTVLLQFACCYNKKPNLFALDIISLL